MLRAGIGVRKFSSLYFLLVLSAAGSLQAQRGAVTLARNIIQLTDRADVVVHGRVVYAHVEPHPQYRNLNSVVVTVAVEEVLKGAADKTLTFRQFVWDSRDHADSAGYRVGDEIVLFLNQATAAGFSSPVGLEQGRFRVFYGPQGEPMVVNGVNNYALFQGTQAWSASPKLSPKARQALAQPEEEAKRVPLSVLKDVIHTLVATPGGRQ